LIDDPSQKKRIKELREEMEEWFARYVDLSKDGIIDDGTEPPDHYGQTRLIR